MSSQPLVDEKIVRFAESGSGLHRQTAKKTAPLQLEDEKHIILVGVAPDLPISHTSL